MLIMALLIVGCDKTTDSNTKSARFYDMRFQYNNRFSKTSSSSTKNMVIYKKHSACYMRVDYRDVTKKEDAEDLERSIFNSLCSRYTIKDEEVNGLKYQSCLTDSHVKHLSFLKIDGEKTLEYDVSLTGYEGEDEICSTELKNIEQSITIK